MKITLLAVFIVALVFTVSSVDSRRCGRVRGYGEPCDECNG